MNKDSNDHIITASDIIQQQTGGAEARHTFAHPNIAIAVAMWLSPGFMAAVSDLIRRYMEGKVKSADSRAEAAAVQAASAPVLPEPALQAKRPFSDIEDEIIMQHTVQKQRFVGEMGKLEMMVDSSDSFFSRFSQFAGGVPASQQLIQTLRANTVVRVGTAAENAQLIALQPPTASLDIVPGGFPLAAPYAATDMPAMQLNLQRGVTLQQVAASKNFRSIFVSADFLASVGRAVSSIWERDGNKTLIVDGPIPKEYRGHQGPQVVFKGNLGAAMDTHRVKFSQAYRGAMETTAVENAKYDSWVYPPMAKAMITKELDKAKAAVEAQEAGGKSQPPITNHFVRAV